jgi:MFS family permease
MFAERRFRLMLSALATSRAGDFLYSVALTVALLASTGSIAWVGAAWLGRLLPVALLSALAGAVGDRFERHAVLVTCDVVRAFLMAGLAGAVLTEAPPLVLVAIVFTSAVAGVPSAPTFYALLPEAVDANDLPMANSAVSVVQYVAMVGGPAAGAVLVVLGSPALAIALNAATFAASALLLSRLPRGKRRFSRSPDEAADRGRRASGLMLVWRDRPSRDAVVVTGLSTITLGFWLVSAALVATEHLGAPSSAIGWFDAAMGVGGVLGAPVAARFAERGRLWLRLAIWSAFCNLPLALVVVVGPLPITALLISVGAASVALEVVTTTVLQRRIASDSLASAEGVSTSAVFGGLLLGATVAPVLIASVGLQLATLVATAVPTIVGFAALVRWRPSRTLALDCATDQLAVTA